MKLTSLVAGPLLVSAFFVLVGTADSSAATSDATLGGLRAELGDGHVMLSFTLDGAFDEAFKRRLESGLPTDLTFRFRLLRDRKRWFDKDLATSSLQVVAMYNAVTREYLINYKQDGTLIESRVVRTDDDLRAAMTRFEHLPAFSLEGLETTIGDRRLLVRARAELGTRTILSLIPTTITTAWAESAKFRPDAAPGGHAARLETEP